MKKILLFVTLILFSYSQAQNILIVDNNVNVDTSPSHIYNNFAAAIAAAANGDIIYIQPSITSYGNITVSKEITVYGIGHTPELNSGRSTNIGNILIAASNVKISGLNIVTTITINNTIHSNITIENNKFEAINMASAITNNVIIQGNVIGSAIYLSSNNANSTNITITNNFIDSPTANPFQYFNSTTIFNNNVINWVAVTTQALFYIPTDLVAQNNIFVSQNTFNGTVWQTAGTPTIFNNCLTYSYSGVTLGALNGTGNYNNTNPLFVSIPGTNPNWDVANDYHLGAGSTGVNVGTDSNDVGIFNGYYDFDMRGYPTLLPYLTEMTISNNMIPAGANLNVNLKADANKSN
ncbi:MAG: hypothetical protein R2816_09335 [Flavobacteriaceae bacterium]|nr:hypothetical protein [Flavobacteriaceae bacterium]